MIIINLKLQKRKNEGKKRRNILILFKLEKEKHINIKNI